MKSINIGIVGYGTVGHGVVNLLRNNNELIKQIAILILIFVA